MVEEKDANEELLGTSVFNFIGVGVPTVALGESVLAVRLYLKNPIQSFTSKTKYSAESFSFPSQLHPTAT